MTAVFLLCKLLLVALSLAGWCLLLTGRFGLRVEFAPIVTFSGVGVAMTAAGLLNIFTPVQWALYLGGLGLFAAFALREREAFKPWLSLRVLVLLLACLWLLWLTRGGLIWGHDNMAHWAIMAKRMITGNQLPNTADVAIEFTGYPPGAACFIKYLCAFVGFSDGLLMLGQGLLILAGLFTLTAFVPRRGWLGGLAVAVFGLFFVTCGVPLNDLRVDTLLGSQGLAGLAIVAFYAPHAPARALWAALAPLTFLAVVKNSGLFFIAADLIVLLYFALRAHTPGSSLLRGAALGLGLPVGSYWLWLRHVALVFPEGESSKHAVSLEAYSGIFGEKTPEEIAQFNSLFFAHLRDLSQSDIRIALLVIVALVLCVVLLAVSREHRKAEALWLAVGAVAAEGLYLVSLWCTYTLSMNTSEMLCLASIQRYHTTTLAFLGGAALLVLLSLLADERTGGRMLLGVGTVVLCLALVLPGAKNLPTVYSRAPYHDREDQAPILDLKEQYGLTDGSRYLLYVSPGQVDTWSLRYIARYVLNTDCLDFWQHEDQSFTWNEVYANYDYFIQLAPDERSAAFMEENGFDPAQTVTHLLVP